MRYLDAYELISTSLMANNLPFPVTEPLVARFFDDHVINVALRCNRKTNKEVLSVSGTSAAFTNTDIQAKKFTSQIFKVEKTNSDGTLGAVPFVPESAVLVGDDKTISHLGYYFKTDISRGTITNVSTNTTTVTVTANNSLDAGDYVILSEIAGNTAALNNSWDSVVNDKRFKVQSATSSNFVITTSEATPATYTAGGVFVEDTKKIFFNKSISENITVYYYALPEEKNSNKSRIDIADQLITAAMHYTFADIYFITSNLELGGPHRNLANSIEKEFMKVNRAKEANHDILPAPLQDFL